ncbi:MAG: sugar phosphate isomerase/epimerase [Clostridia bacterium]|nr:sugar phosphate isomerase/epimerase [Clostridia bacterium]
MKTAFYSYFSNLVLKDGIEKAAEYAANLGFSAVEFIDVYPKPHVCPDPEAAREYKATLNAHGLTVACYSVGIPLIQPGNADYDSESAVRYLEETAKIASELGSPFLHHTLIPRFDNGIGVQSIDFPAVLEQLLPYTCRVADTCAELGLTTLYEPQGFFVNGKDNFPEFYRKMKCLGKRVGVCGDTGNPVFCAWRPEDFYRELAAEIMHVHIKNYRLNTVNPQRKSYTATDGTTITPCFLDEGDIDLRFCLDTLKGLGYDGAVALEDEYIGDITECLRRDLITLSGYIS